MCRLLPGLLLPTLALAVFSKAAMAVSPAGDVARADVILDEDGPRILVVTAHHDDETMFAATLYGIAQHFGGQIDQVVITDGSGGFDYAMLAEPLYDKILAVEPEARDNLPAVRKQEIMAGGRIIGMRNYFFLDEYDHMYTTNVDTVLQHVWDVSHVRNHLAHILRRGRYDVVFTLLPEPEQHGHHKAATILALEAVNELSAADRPAVVGGLATTAEDSNDVQFDGLDGYLLTVPTTSEPFFRFDKRRPLEVDSLLTYHVIVNWVMAEHKSQGTLQLLINAWDIETFWLLDASGYGAEERTRELFDRLDAWRPGI